MYLKPKAKVALVKGITGCAIYDFSKRRLYRLNLDAYTVYRQLEEENILKETALKSLYLPFYQRCLQHGILEFSSNPKAKFASPESLFEQVRCNYAWFEITNNCNQKCLHCYLGELLNQGEMPYSKVIETIDDLINNGLYHLCISGGEPFVHTRIKDILSYLIRKDIKVSILSNGTVLNASIIALLKHPKIQLKIPILGWGETHNHMIGDKNLFSKCIENLKWLKQENIRFEIGTTVTDVNKYDLAKIQDFANTLGVPYSKSPVYKTGFAEGYWKELCSDYNEILSYAKNEPHNGKGEKVEPTISPTELEYIDWEDSKIGCDDCAADKIAIDFRGNIYPCLLLRSRPFKMGNIYKESLTDVLARKHAKVDPATKNLAFTDMPLCGRCEVRYLCKGGGCRAVTHHLYDNIKKRSPFWDACYYNQQNQENVESPSVL